MGVCVCMCMCVCVCVCVCRLSFGPDNLKQIQYHVSKVIVVKWTYKKKDCARGERKRDRAIIVEESELDNILIKGIFK